MYTEHEDSITVFTKDKVLKFMLQDVGKGKLELFHISVFVLWEIIVLFYRQ
jgi:hypothetical protein